MKQISMHEFKRYCDNKEYKTFILDSANQEHDVLPITLRMKLVFDSLTITSNPNVMCFASGENKIFLHQIKYIVKKRDSILGHIYDIVCNDLCNSNNISVYTIIAR